ncbi:SRPBCC family protein [Nonomuraea recticatena]|uniref:hypothetical protein n=1 Tax=Nonomuraea recticatena TaxID=46178 RepID=UPI0036139CF9
MSHEFELHHELSVEASPEQVWEAIATGPGIDSWFMGRTQVEEGVIRTAFGGYTPRTPSPPGSPASDWPPPANPPTTAASSPTSSSSRAAPPAAPSSASSPAASCRATTGRPSSRP